MKGSMARSPRIALLLSFLTPGLGQMYNGQMKRGIILYLAGGLIAITLVSTGLFFKFYTMVLCLAILAAFFFFVWSDAYTGAAKSKDITLKPYNKWYLYLLVILITAFVIQPSFSSIIKNNIVRAYKTPSGGMEPALLVGDYFIADMRLYKNEKPKRGDVVIFEYPKDPSKDFIKRVIGVEGEKVEINGGRLYINDKEIGDSWGQVESKDKKTSMQTSDTFGPVLVPKDSVFVLGDNRDNSQDSRHWGFVSTRQTKGKALYIYWARNKSRIGMQIK
jgi:signal peptidase I